MNSRLGVCDISGVVPKLHFTFPFSFPFRLPSIFHFHLKRKMIFRARNVNLEARALSIATKMVLRPRVAVYIWMVEDTCWPPWCIPRTGGAETILVAVETVCRNAGRPTERRVGQPSIRNEPTRTIRFSNSDPSTWRREMAAAYKQLNSQHGLSQGPLDQTHYGVLIASFSYSSSFFSLFMIIGCLLLMSQWSQCFLAVSGLFLYTFLPFYGHFLSEKCGV